MSHTFQESGLSFDFGDDWHVLKYDEHAFYRNQVVPSMQGKGVDFLGVCADTGLVLMEVTHYRQASTPPREMRKIAHETSEKVRDTLAAMIGAYHMDTQQQEQWRPFLQAILRTERRPYVVLWFEQSIENRPVVHQRLQQKRDVLSKLLKKPLRWLTTDVLVVGKLNYSNFLGDLTVS